MAKKFLILTLAGFFALGAAGVLAQTSTNAEVRANAVQRLQEQKQKLSEELRQQLEARKADMQKNIETKRAEFQNALREKRVEVEQERRELQEKFKERLQNVKDEKKKAILTKLEEQLPQVQERVLTNMTASLNRIEEVLKKISSRADELRQQGKDVAAVRAAVSAAADSIAKARTAIQNESGKAYSIEITDEAKAKENFGTVRAELAKNLQAVRDAVKAAQESVRKAITELKEVSGTASPSPEVTPNI